MHVSFYECVGSVDKAETLSIGPGVASELRERMFLLGGRWEYQLSAVPAPCAPDNQRLPNHSTTQSQPWTWYLHYFILYINKTHQKNG